MSIFLRWGVPALVTVVGGASLAISTTSAGMMDDLSARTAAVLAGADFGWVSVAFDARDAVIAGTAASQDMIDSAVLRVASVHGVRSVRSEAVIAELASPFPFAATVGDGAIALSGGVPDEEARAALLRETGAAGESLKLLAGAPDSSLWHAAVDYGFAHLGHFDEGGFTLSDLTITIDGRAKSAEAFDALTLLAAEPPPEGVTVAARDVRPALVPAFGLEARFDGARVSVSGFTASVAFAESLRRDGIAGYPVSTSLVLASGAPAGFEDDARLLLENLVKLEWGSATISDGTLTIEGAPGDAATAAAVETAMAAIGATATLTPPRADVYRFVASRAGDVTTLEGHVPDAGTRERLESLDEVDAGGLELARGAPERFDSGVEFGLELLGHMSEGRFLLENTRLSVEGRAATAADFEAIATMLELGAPQGLILAASDVKPPLATPFVWSAEKDAEGGIRMAGYVPSKGARAALHAAVAVLQQDSATIADGSPANFETEALAALGILAGLEAGRIAYDGTHWTLAGSVATNEAAPAVEEAFTKAGLAAAGWSLELDVPLPVVDPYSWSARKAADGTIALAGFVPDETLRQTLARQAGNGLTDATSLGAGAPEGFADGAVAALEALAGLEEGSVTLEGGKWTLAGRVTTTAERFVVEGGLRAAVDMRGWTVDIVAADEPPVIADFRWAASKAADGRISLSGYVTSEELRAFIAVRAGAVAEDTTEIAAGAPAGFVVDVLAGLEALRHFSAGAVSLENGGWSLSGTPKSAVDAELAVAALDELAGDASGWETQIGEPVPVETPPEMALSEPDLPVTAAEPAPTVADAGQDQVAPPGEASDAVEMAALHEPTAVPDAAAEPQASPVFSALKPLGGGIELAGAVPSATARQLFGLAAGNESAGALVVNTDLPDGFLQSADAGIRLLASLASGEFVFDGASWRLVGRVASEADRSAALATVAALPAASGWQTDIALLPPLDLCRIRIAGFAGRNEILFQSGSARLADTSLPALDELAGYLGGCPEATIYVEGHTDADGAAELNLALSVARAEAVVTALIERGVAYQRLYAVGYGESLPVADNDTAAGKRANRRIGFSIVDSAD